MRFSMYKLKDFDGVNRNLIIPENVKNPRKLLYNCNALFKVNLSKNEYLVLKNRYHSTHRDIIEILDNNDLYDMMFSYNDEKVIYIALPDYYIGYPVLGQEKTMLEYSMYRYIKFPLLNLSPDNVRILIEYVMNMLMEE